MSEPVTYVNKRGVERVVRTAEDAVRASYDGFKPRPEPAKPARAKSGGES